MVSSLRVCLAWWHAEKDEQIPSRPCNIRHTNSDDACVAAHVGGSDFESNAECDERCSMSRAIGITVFSGTPRARCCNSTKSDARNRGAIVWLYSPSPVHPADGEQKRTEHEPPTPP